MDRYELRRLDYSLSEDHEALQAAYRQFFKTHCSIETVRAAEESGFDKSLWERLCAHGRDDDGAARVRWRRRGDAGRPDAGGRGDRPVAGAGPVDRPCLRRSAARTAWAHWTPTSSTASSWRRFDPQHDTVSGVTADPDRLDRRPDHRARRRPDIVRLTFGTRPAKVDNIGRLPMAWVDPASADSRTVLASGAEALAEYQRALDEWRVLTAAALVGLVEETMTIAAEFAKTRYTLGVPISTLQGISHPLANIAITVQGGRNLARRAAWFLDNEPDERPELAPSAFVFMAEEASKAATMACTSRAVSVSPRRRPRRHIWSVPAGGRWPAATPAPARSTSPRSSRPAKVVQERAHKWISHGFELSDDDQAFLRRGARLPAHPCHRRRHPPRSRDRRQLRRGCAPGARRRGIPGAANGSRSPTAASTGCAAGSGNSRSDAHTCRG